MQGYPLTRAPAGRLVEGVRQFGRLYLAFTLGFLVAAHGLTAMADGRSPDRIVVEAVVLWLTVALPPYIALHLLLALGRGLGRLLRPGRIGRRFG